MRIKIAVSLVLATLVALFIAGSAQAAPTVSNTNDSGAGSLRQALIEAAPGDTIVVPAGTYTLTSDPLEIVKSVTIAGHGAGDTTIRAGVPMGVFEITGPLDATISGVTIRDGSISSTVALGAGIQSVKANLTVRDSVLTNNVANTNGGPGESGGVALGGAIWAVEGSLNLINCMVTGNVATSVGSSEKNGGVALGGGVYAEGPVSLSNTTLNGNRADARGGQGPTNSNQGGGVALGGGVYAEEGNFSLSGGEASGNTVLASGGSGDSGGVAIGGGVYVEDGSQTIANAKFNGNLVDARGGQGPSDPNQSGGVALGGGVFAEEGNFSLSGGEANGNTVLASGGSGDNGGVALGGGVMVESHAATISNSTVSGNAIDARGGQGAANVGQFGGVALGGGLYLEQESPANPSSITGSTFSGNSADSSAGPGSTSGVVEGGGLHIEAEDAPLSIANTTVASNVARQHSASGGVAEGGGLWSDAAAPGSLTLTSVTIAANRLDLAGSGSAEGGNLYWTEATTIRNSIVAGGAGPGGSENCSKPTKVVSLGFNLESSDQCGFHAAGDQVNKDPLLGPLQSNGGPTQTMAPSASSPAVDQGTSAGLGSDQRGVVRPIDLPSIPNSAAPGADGSDVGAVELQPSNAFTLGKLKRNKKKGTARLSVFLSVPSAGTLTLSGKGLKKQTVTITGQAEVKLLVALRSKKLKKALRKKGRRKVGINVTYAPTGNSAATQSRKAKLIKKKKKKHRKHSKPGKR